MTWRAQGFRAWLWQRVSAVYMALFLVGFFVVIVSSGPWDYEAWRGLIGHGVTSLLIAVFFLAILIHSWVGIRDVVIDYVHVVAIRLTVLGLAGLMLIAMGLWVMRILTLASV